MKPGYDSLYRNASRVEKFPVIWCTSAEIFNFKHSVPRPKVELVTELCAIWSGSALPSLIQILQDVLHSSLQLCQETLTHLQALKGKRTEAESLSHVRLGNSSVFARNKRVVPLTEGCTASWPRDVTG